MVGYSYHNLVLLHSLPPSFFTLPFIIPRMFAYPPSAPGADVVSHSGIRQRVISHCLHCDERQGIAGPWSPVALAEERWVRLQRAWRIRSALNKEIKVDSTTWAWWREPPYITGHGTWPHTTLVLMYKLFSRLLCVLGMHVQMVALWSFLWCTACVLEHSVCEPRNLWKSLERCKSLASSEKIRVSTQNGRSE